MDLVLGRNFMNQEKEGTLCGFEVDLSDMSFNCPLCELFVTEAGILNAEAKDLLVFSTHMREDHRIILSSREIIFSC